MPIKIQVKCSLKCYWRTSNLCCGQHRERQRRPLLTVQGYPRNHNPTWFQVNLIKVSTISLYSYCCTPLYPLPNQSTMCQYPCFINKGRADFGNLFGVWFARISRARAGAASGLKVSYSFNAHSTELHSQPVCIDVGDPSSACVVIRPNKIRVDLTASSPSFVCTDNSFRKPLSLGCTVSAFRNERRWTY